MHKVLLYRLLQFPLILAVIYLLVLLYFKAIGGYKPVHIVPVAEQKAANPPQTAVPS